VSRIYTIGVVVFDGVLCSEVIGPAEVFAIAGQHEDFGGAQVVIVGVEQQPVIRTAEGIRIGVDATIADAPTLDVLIIPGGNDMSHLQRNQELRAFIQKQEQAGQWLGSVCAGAFLLGAAGVLDGKHATTWHGGERRLQEQFPAIHVVHDQPVVLDHRTLTANGGLVSYRAALVLLGQLSSSRHALEVYTSLGIERLGTWDDIAATITMAHMAM